MSNDGRSARALAEHHPRSETRKWKTRSYLKARECKVLQNRLAGVRLYHVHQGRHHLRSRRARGGKIYVREQSPWDYPEEKRGCPPTRLDDFVNHPFLSVSSRK